MNADSEQNMENILFFDLETSDAHQIVDIGAVYNGETYRGLSLKPLAGFMKSAPFVCGHSIVQHDIPMLLENRDAQLFSPVPCPLPRFVTKGAFRIPFPAIQHR